YNVLEDRQLEARGVLPFIRRGFAGRMARIPAIQYDPNETIPNVTKAADPRRWLSAVIYPIKDADGGVREVVLIHEDITARHRAEEERERVAFLVENSHDFIGMCDLGFTPFFVSREGLRLVGLESVEQCRHIPITEFFFPEDRAFMTEEFFP